MHYPTLWDHNENHFNFENIQDFLSTLWNIKLIEISRQEYDLLKNTFFVENWNQTIIYIPQNYHTWDLLNILYSLENEWLLKDSANLKQLSRKIKFWISYILKSNSWEFTANEFIENYGVSNYAKDNIKNASLSLSDKKAMLKKWKKWKSLIEENNISEDIKYSINREFIWSFFKESLTTLQLWMKIFTQNEQTELINFLSDDKGYTNKTENNTLFIESETNGSDISKSYIRNNIDSLNSSELLLRNYIWIDAIKERLEFHKKMWQDFMFEATQLWAMRKIFSALFEYPYVLKHNDTGYKIKNIMQDKHMHCVWFCILAHALFEELWIKNKWFFQWNHIVLKVEIWEKNYYFDPTNIHKYIPEIISIKQQWEETIYTLKNQETFVGVEWTSENILISTIFINLSIDSGEQGNSKIAENHSKIANSFWKE